MRIREIRWCPGNQLALCQRDEALACDIGDVETRLIDVDGDNGAIWVRLAGIRLRAGDGAAAAPYLDRAITAPRFDSYFLEHTLALEQGLAAIGGLSYTERIFQAIGLSAALAIPYGDITRFCAALDASQREWQKRCHQLGAQLTSESNTAIDMMIGFALVKIAAEYDGDSRRMAEIERQRTEFRTAVFDLIADDETSALLENDEKVLRDYIDRFSAHGELAALEYLQQEAIRLRQQPDYNPCNFVPRWVGE